MGTERHELLTLAQRIHSHIQALCRSFRLGNALKRGIPVAIVGETNAGKSTLLNALVGEDRALVSDVKGTTRDTIEETVTLGDTLVRFIDTAGIRDTSDSVERMGIDRTFAKIAEADIVVWLIDLTDARQQFETLAPRLLPECEGKRMVVILNKLDLTDEATRGAMQTYVTERLASLLPQEPVEVLALSAHSASCVEQLEQLLSHSLESMKHEAGQSADLSAASTIVSNLRHYEALAAALTAIDRVIDGLHAGLSGDFISQDLRECIYHLSDIAGEVTTDDVLGNIFKHFCVGK